MLYLDEVGKRAEMYELKNYPTLAYNGLNITRVAQKPEEVTKSAEDALASPLVYGSSIRAELRQEAAGVELDVYGSLSMINPGSQESLKYLFYLYEDFLEYEAEDTMHLVRGIQPSAKGSSIRAKTDEIVSVKKTFDLSDVYYPEYVGAMFVVFDGKTGEIYTYSHWTVYAPNLTGKLADDLFAGADIVFQYDKPIKLNFDKPIDPASFGEDTVLLVSDIGRTIKCSYEVDGSTCTITPSSELKKGSSYTLYIKGSNDGLMSADGYTMNNSIVCPFTADVASQPVLEVDTNEFALGPVSGKITKQVKVSNTGTATLTGRASVGMSWITIDPINFTVEPGESIDINVAIDPTDLPSGEHTCALIISTDGGNVTIPISLSVIKKELEVSVSPESLDFGSVDIGSTKSLNLTVTASESADIKIETSDDWIKVDLANFSSTNQIVRISVTPKKEGSNNGSVKVIFGTQEIVVPVSINGIAAQSSIKATLSSTITSQTSISVSFEVSPPGTAFDLYQNGAKVKTAVATDSSGKANLTVSLKPGINTFKATTTNVTKPASVEFTIVKQMIIELWVGKTKFVVDGVESTLDVEPTVSSPPLPAALKNNTYMPIRAVAEALGAAVGWVAAEKKVTLEQTTIDGGKKFVELWINKTTAKVNGVETKLNADGTLYPAIISSRTMLPLRFVAETLGASVGWDGAERKITLTYPGE
ncbi:MAG TPA: stalk domain-containing protein [Caldisericia bacterium]|nr:stalk domain-containing protein [Caldisericia bacterium]HPF49017.1 stalk domain-containing protein [Caldisericia bacterium]HPI83119.1 stalk domain-containing protein [Caldisericia bacterium]HPQ92346.1 stalk domain-containing protein [Caldisericia bacterium]HRV74556.1 stalk domain-containing protein [Caldisericia bacterium]